MMCGQKKVYNTRVSLKTRLPRFARNDNPRHCETLKKSWQSIIGFLEMPTNNFLSPPSSFDGNEEKGDHQNTVPVELKTETSTLFFPLVFAA